MSNSEAAAPMGDIIGNGLPPQNSNAKSNQPLGALKPRAKKFRLLAALVTGPKTSFELERAPVFDHCANSTVSEWRKKGLDIRTEMVTVAGYAGEPAHIARYSLTPEAFKRAINLLRDER